MAKQKTNEFDSIQTYDEYQESLNLKQTYERDTANTAFIKPLAVTSKPNINIPQVVIRPTSTGPLQEPKTIEVDYDHLNISSFVVNKNKMAAKKRLGLKKRRLYSSPELNSSPVLPLDTIADETALPVQQENTSKLSKHKKLAAISEETVNTINNASIDSRDSFAGHKFQPTVGSTPLVEVEEQPKTTTRVKRPRKPCIIEEDSDDSDSDSKERQQEVIDYCWQKSMILIKTKSNI